jgi:hypothetical protein
MWDKMDAVTSFQGMGGTTSCCGFNEEQSMFEAAIMSAKNPNVLSNFNMRFITTELKDASAIQIR